MKKNQFPGRIGMSIVLTLAVSWLAAMAHVCRLHGTARYTGWQQYMRKSCPVFALPNVLLPLQS